jgi:integrase
MRVLRTFIPFLRTFHPGVYHLKQITADLIEEFKRRRIEGEIVELDSPEDGQREQKLELARKPSGYRYEDTAKFGWTGRQRLHHQVSPKTINYEIQVLSTLLEWTRGKNLIFFNPASQVEKLRLQKKSLPKFITLENLEKFFTDCRAYERRLFATLFFTGMRSGENEHLTWDDINFDLGVIFIQEKEDWKPKTGERIIPVFPLLRDILREERESRGSDTWVFANRNGNLHTHLLDEMKKICRRAGIPEASPHRMRHSVGAHLRMAGSSLADIADILGHRNLSTTKIYAKVEQEHLRSVISKLGTVVPVNVSPKSVTQQEIPKKEDSKLLTTGNLGEDQK